MAAVDTREAFLKGETTWIQGSGKHPYKLENQDGVYSCSCPAWRNQKDAIDKRTCKHLKTLLGEEAELIRVAAAQGRKLRNDEKAKISGPPVMLAHAYDESVDPTGWWYSEKLDGVRAYWNGTDFVSRQGNIFKAPDWFKRGLPDHPLDGELWIGRQKFQETVGIVKRMNGGDLWKKVQYIVFDVPHLDGPFESRIRYASQCGQPGSFMRVLGHARVESQEHLLGLLKEFEAAGAEGLMIRKPGSLYEVGRSHSLLKVKPFKDAEAMVVGHEPGKGKHKGRVGALVVMLPDGKQFCLGTGMSDADRENPPAIGTTVTFRYTELTSGGIPKCASFVRVRVPE